MATASTAAAGTIAQRGNPNSSVFRGLPVKDDRHQKRRATITASCKLRVARAKPSKPAGAPDNAR